MPEYRHPRALDSVPGHPPARVSLGGSHTAVDGETFESDDAAAVERLASAYDVAVSDLRVGGETCDAELSDGGTCGRDLPCPYHSDDETED